MSYLYVLKVDYPTISSVYQNMRQINHPMCCSADDGEEHTISVLQIRDHHAAYDLDNSPLNPMGILVVANDGTQFLAHIWDVNTDNGRESVSVAIYSHHPFNF